MRPQRDKVHLTSRLHNQVFWGSVEQVGDTHIKPWVQNAYAAGAILIILVAGFPCKGTSRANATGGKRRPNLNHEQSKLFWEIPRIRDLFLMHRELPVLFVVESVAMQEEIQRLIASVLGCLPIVVQASPVCPASRDNSFGCSGECRPWGCETLERGPLGHRLKLDSRRAADDWIGPGWLRSHTSGATNGAGWCTR